MGWVLEQHRVEVLSSPHQCLCKWAVPAGAVDCKGSGILGRGNTPRVFGFPLQPSPRRALSAKLVVVMESS